jgi:dihydroxyacid dehydratase/phosphogluconate dehydratase
MFYAMGVTEEQLGLPIVGVATTWNEAAPCNISLSRQAQAAKKGVAAAGGLPREFTTITVTDGIAMGHAGMKSSLVSRVYSPRPIPGARRHDRRRLRGRRHAQRRQNERCRVA